MKGFDHFSDSEDETTSSDLIYNPYSTQNLSPLPRKHSLMSDLPSPVSSSPKEVLGSPEIDRILQSNFRDEYFPPPQTSTSKQALSNTFWSEFLDNDTIVHIPETSIDQPSYSPFLDNENLDILQDQDYFFASQYASGPRSLSKQHPLEYHTSATNTPYPSSPSANPSNSTLFNNISISDSLNSLKSTSINDNFRTPAHRNFSPVFSPSNPKTLVAKLNSPNSSKYQQESSSFSYNNSQSGFFKKQSFLELSGKTLDGKLSTFTQQQDTQNKQSYQNLHNSSPLSQNYSRTFSTHHLGFESCNTDEATTQRDNPISRSPNSFKNDSYLSSSELPTLEKHVYSTNLDEYEIPSNRQSDNINSDPFSTLNYLDEKNHSESQTDQYIFSPSNGEIEDWYSDAKQYESISSKWFF
ncbi:hypothetical protein BB560_001509 [Smittium megazygosporum]|uniref:Uncharacterized protein n=1 Tax=Smittium megazygosporum TaxID=133381 RepID=A0A2T9ZHD3_9FUNG|nr:hypothetical protein BB560_001509 [Smittium megazygosporum]